MIERWRRVTRLMQCVGVLSGVAIGLAACGGKGEQATDSTAAPGASATASVAKCPGDNGGLVLPPGFCATVFADSIGRGRHVAVAPNGDVFVNTWKFPSSEMPSPAGGFIVALRDTNRDGRADRIERFGPSAAEGGTGGTGIDVYHGAVYVEAGSRIVRYPLSTDGLAPTGAPTTILSGLPTTGNHFMHPFVIDSSGAMYVNLGSATNSCQVKDRTLESPGHKPCTEREKRDGIWLYDANKTGQQFSGAERYATGIRNAVGLAIGPDGGVYSTQHGRDQLAENWPKLYTAEQGQNLPAEELLKIEKGADYGWPMCYYDGTQQKLVLAPEYGGDGGKAIGDCGSKQGPIAFFPAHWAPDGLTFYTGTQFPSHYHNGAFIAFHGSWNRAPGPQGGYNVVFVPFTNGAPTGISAFEVFANGFAGDIKQPDRAAHRPTGITQGPDGALYITDDKGGRVWRVTYNGGGTTR